MSTVSLHPTHSLPRPWYTRQGRVVPTKPKCVRKPKRYRCANWTTQERWDRLRVWTWVLKEEEVFGGKCPVHFDMRAGGVTEWCTNEDGRQRIPHSRTSQMGGPGKDPCLASVPPLCGCRDHEDCARLLTVGIACAYERTLRCVS